MGHYYEQDGTPRYTVKAKASGLDRQTTIADARKLNLVPSVTTITSVLSKDGLELWKRYQLMECVCQNLDEMNRSFKGGGVAEFRAKVWADYKKNTEVYNKRGSEIHKKLEEYYKQLYQFECPDEDKAIYQNTINVVCGIDVHDKVNYTSEYNFASNKGYGGQIDLVIRGNTTSIVDFKTKNNDNPGTKDLYIEYLMQIAAYRNAVNKNADCYNLLISVTNPGVVYLHKYTEEELEKGWKMFQLLLDYWKLTNSYDSSMKEKSDVNIIN